MKSRTQLLDVIVMCLDNCTCNSALLLLCIRPTGDNYMLILSEKLRWYLIEQRQGNKVILSSHDDWMLCYIGSYLYFILLFFVIGAYSCLSGVKTFSRIKEISELSKLTQHWKLNYIFLMALIKI